MEDFTHHSSARTPEIVAARGTDAYLDRPILVTPPESDIKSPLDYWNLLRRRKLLVSSLVLLGTLAGALATLRQTPLYRARTSLEIQNAEEAALRTGMEGRETATLSETAMQSYLQTQVVILESRSFRKRVTQKLLKDKPHAFYTIDSLSGWRQVFGISTEEPERTIQTGTPPVEVEVRVVPNTRIIEISVDSPDPTYSSDFANGMANEFLGYNLESRWEASKRTTDWLTTQLESFKTSLKESEDRLQAYRQQAGLSINDTQEGSLEQAKLRQIQEELSRAEAARISVETVFDITKSTPPDAIPEIADNPRLSQYQTRLAELRRQLAELRVDYLETHPDVQRVAAQIRQMDATIAAEKANTLARIESEYNTAKKKQQAMERNYQAQLGVVANQASKMVNYSLLKREVDTNRSLYDILLAKMKEAGISAAASSSDSRVVDLATAPTRPYKPNIYLNTLGGFMAGFILSIGVVILREQMDTTYRAPGETTMHLQLPELGVIPSRAALPANGRRALLRAGSSKKQPLELATWQDAPSMLAESFRNVMASILISAREQSKGRVLLVTSACREDGKTTTLANLGIALSEIDQRVLLIDADMRMPRLHKIFDIPIGPGLSDVLVDSVPVSQLALDETIKETKVKGLKVLSAGTSPTSIAKLLHSPRVGELLHRVQSEFDIVLIDTPPLLSISDARVLGHLTGGTIMVVRAGKTPRDLALAAKQRLTDDGVRLLGTILVAWDGKGRARYGAEHYFSSYYARTGSGA